MISYVGGDKISEIHVKQDGNRTQCFEEDMFFSTLNIFKPVRVTDINGDGLQDVKIIVPYQGNGIASLYVKVIYLFQNIEGDFTKVSFTDMMDDDRSERDIDGDGKYEIITMGVQNHENHNYWLFNLFEYKEGGLVNVNNKKNYPIMIQYRYRKNYKVSENIGKEIMKTYSLQLPENYSKE